MLEYLRSLRLLASPIIATDGRATALDLSVGSRLRGREIDNLGVAEFSDLIDEVMRDADTEFAFGRYAEPRELYSNENFASDETGEGTWPANYNCPGQLVISGRSIDRMSRLSWLHARTSRKPSSVFSP